MKTSALIIVGILLGVLNAAKTETPAVCSKKFVDTLSMPVYSDPTCSKFTKEKKVQEGWEKLVGINEKGPCTKVNGVKDLYTRIACEDDDKKKPTKFEDLEFKFYSDKDCKTKKSLNGADK